MRTRAALIAVTFLGCLLPVYAQERGETNGPAVYKVEFDIRDASAGATQPGQHFSMLVDESRKGVFQAGSRVPAASNSAQYVDAGVKIECSVHESEGKAALRGSIELTAITGHVSTSAISQPIIGQRNIAFNITVELSSPTVIIDDRNASAASPNSLGGMAARELGVSSRPRTAGGLRQVETTITKMN